MGKAYICKDLINFMTSHLYKDIWKDLKQYPFFLLPESLKDEYILKKWRIHKINSKLNNEFKNVLFDKNV